MATDSRQSGTPADRGAWNKRLLLLLALVPILVAQAAFALRTQPQPYPAIVLPGFRQTSVGETITKERVTIAVEFRDGHIEEPQQRDVFSDLNYSSIPGTIDFVFEPQDDGEAPRVSDQVREWLRERVRPLHDGAEPETITFCWREFTVDLEALVAEDAACERTRTVDL